MIHANPELVSKGSAKEKAADQPFVVEYYYTAKWGLADEFIQLFRKNHYPVLKKQVDAAGCFTSSPSNLAITPPRTAGGITG